MRRKLGATAAACLGVDSGGERSALDLSFLLLRQPFRPIPGKLRQVIFRYRNEISYNNGLRRVLVFGNFVVEQFDGFTAPFINLLRQQNLHLPAFYITE